MKALLLIAFTFLAFQGISQDSETTRILFILDASNSMNDRWGIGAERETRIKTAKKLLSQTVDGLQGVPNLEVGLRVYGHQTPITQTTQDCNDTKLEVPLGANNHQQIKNRIQTIQAKGTTPIARSLEAAASDFPSQDGKNVIILITDGIEACDNDPCVIAKKLKDKGVNVTPFVIGLGLDLSYLEKFKCIGAYTEAETQESFEKVLNNVVNKALNNTTAQINLNTVNGDPLETDVTMFLYESGTTNLKYTMTHTINRYGNPDTLILDPSVQYDLVVNTIPRIEKKGIKIIRNTHNTINVDAGQGYINLRFINAARPYQVDARVMLPNSPMTLNTQKIGEKGHYLVGTYQIEVLTLPRIYATVTVEQSQDATVNIKAPGFFKYNSSQAIVGQVFHKNVDGTWDWVYDLEDGKKSGLQNLQPGGYRIVYRPVKLKKTEYTIERDFRINSNKTTSIQL